MRSALFALVLALPSPALAFCGTYVAGPDESVFNKNSEVIIADNGGSITLTIANDMTGADELGMLIPVPQSFDESTLALVDAAVINRVGDYDSPRLVELSCEDLYSTGSKVSCSGCASAVGGLLGGLMKDTVGGLLDEYGVARAEIAMDAIFPATLEELRQILGEAGMQMTSAQEALLEDLIEQDVGFVWARVVSEEPTVDTFWLPPIQLSYDTDMIALPIQLGALNGREQQDLIIHVISEDGGAGISNYPEMDMEAECMYKDPLFSDFGDFYEERFEQAFQEAGGEAAWLREYYWMQATHCDPCVDGGPLDQGTMDQAGYQGDADEAGVTRLHLRFRPAFATEPLSIYISNGVPQGQQRYIEHIEELESDFPTCDEGWEPFPGTCEVEDTAAMGLQLPGLWLLAGTATLGGLRRRRRG